MTSLFQLFLKISVSVVVDCLTLYVPVWSCRLVTASLVDVEGQQWWWRSALLLLMMPRDEDRHLLHVGVPLCSCYPVHIVLRLCAWLQVCTTLTDEHPLPPQPWEVAARAADHSVPIVRRVLHKCMYMCLKCVTSVSSSDGSWDDCWSLWMSSSSDGGMLPDCRNSA